MGGALRAYAGHPGMQVAWKHCCNTPVLALPVKRGRPWRIAGRRAGEGRAGPAPGWAWCAHAAPAAAAPASAAAHQARCCWLMSGTSGTRAAAGLPGRAQLHRPARRRSGGGQRRQLYHRQLPGQACPPGHPLRAEPARLGRKALEKGNPGKHWCDAMATRDRPQPGPRPHPADPGCAGGRAARIGGLACGMPGYDLTGLLGGRRRPPFTSLPEPPCAEFTSP